MRHVGIGLMLIGFLGWILGIVEGLSVPTAVVCSAFFIAGAALAAGEMVRDEIRNIKR